MSEERIIHAHAAELEQLVRWLSEGARLVTLTGPEGSGKSSLAFACRPLCEPHFGRTVAVSGGTGSRSEDFALLVRARLGVDAPSGALLGALPSLLILADVGAVAGVVELVADLVAAVPQLRVVLAHDQPLGLPGEKTLAIAPLPSARGPVTPDEKDALALGELSVFAAEFTEAAAQAVLSRGHAPGTVARLRQLGLLARGASPGKVRLSRTGRAARRISEEERAAAELRHARQLAALESWVEPRIDDEAVDPRDLLVAFRRMRAAEPELAARLLLTAAPWLSVSGVPTEVSAFLDARPSPAVETITLRVRALMLKTAGKLEQAAKLFERAAALNTSSLARASALRELALVRRELGQLEVARPLFEEVLATARAERDEALELHTQRNLGSLHRHAGDFPRARQAYERARALSARVPTSPLARAILDVNLAHLSFAEGRWDEARRLYRSVLEPLAREGDRRTLGQCLVRLGVIELERDREGAAADCFEQAQAILDEARAELALAVARAHLAYLRLQQGRAREASRRVTEIRAALSLQRMGGVRGWNVDSLARLADVLQALALKGDGKALQKAREGLQALQAAGQIPDDVRYLARTLLATEPGSAAAADEHADALIVGPGAGWFELGGKVVDLSRRTPVRELFAKLLAARQATAGAPVAVTELAKVPSLAALPSPLGFSLVEAGVSTLRRLGLGQSLQQAAPGYLIDPQLEITAAP